MSAFISGFKCGLAWPYYAIEALFHWIAKPYVAAARAEIEAEVAAQVLEAYRVGKAHGECEGRNGIIADLNKAIDERHDIFPQMTEEDIERVTKGVLH